MFEIKEKQKVLPDGTKLTTFTREVISTLGIEAEAGTTGFMGGDASRGGRTYFRIKGYGLYQHVRKFPEIWDVNFSKNRSNILLNYKKRLNIEH